MSSVRFNSIDLFRFVAAFFIVVLHSEFNGVSSGAVDVIRQTTRWALPFFFMASGFFLAGKIDDDGRIRFKSIQKTIIRLISIQVVTSLVYILTEWMINGYLNFKLKFLFVGACFHLWYISSLIIGYLGISILYKGNKRWLIGVISIVLLALAIFADGYDKFFGIDLPYSPFRFLLSIPLMYIGICVSGIKSLKKEIILSLLLLGVVMQFFEVNILKTNFGLPIYDRQFVFGVLIVALSVLLFAVNFSIKDNILSRSGMKYSLFVYLYHPLIFLLSKVIFNRMNSIDVITGLYIPVWGFFITLVIAFLFSRKLNPVFRIINGEWRIRS